MHFEVHFLLVLQPIVKEKNRNNLPVRMEVDCPSAFRLSCMWKSVALAWTPGSSTNVEEAVHSSVRSKDRRLGSDGCSASAAVVEKNACGNFQCQCAKDGDDACLKRCGGRISPILSTHSFLPTTEFVSLLSCNPFDRQETLLLRPGDGKCGRTARDHLNEPCQPTHMLLTVSACSVH